LQKGKEEDEVCSEEEIEQVNLYEKLIYDLSDEDDNVVTTKSIDSVVPILVADYADETDDGKCLMNRHTTTSFISMKKSKILILFLDEAPEEIPVKKLKISEISENNKTTKDIINEKTFVQVQEQISMPSTDMQCTNINTELDKSSENDAIKYQGKQKKEKKQKENSKKTIANNHKEKILHKYHNKFLENLLSRDIQHERNLICQCMKFIVDNNFFDSNECF